jgi:signal transduction histidine kinase
VVVRFSLDAGQASLEVQDDGDGFKMPERWINFARQGHLGLVGSAERAEACGGQLSVVAAPGQGTLLRVRVPLPDAPRPHPREE